MVLLIYPIHYPQHPRPSIAFVNLPKKTLYQSQPPSETTGPPRYFLAAITVYFINIARFASSHAPCASILACRAHGDPDKLESEPTLNATLQPGGSTPTRLRHTYNICSDVQRQRYLIQSERSWQNLQYAPMWVRPGHKQVIRPYCSPSPPLPYVD